MSWWQALLAALGLRKPPAPEAKTRPPPSAARPSTARPASPALPPKPSGAKTAADYAAGPEQGLGPAQIRAGLLAAGRLTWREGRWAGLPVPDDEQTRWIDRALVQEGYLRAEDLAQIHAVGELWRKHRDAERWAKVEAERAGDRAVEARRAAQAERKARLRAEAAARAEARAQAVAERRATDILFVGEGVSGELNDRRSLIEALADRKLPVLATPADLADALGLPVPTLRWLCWQALAVRRDHYVHFAVPKRSGGSRWLAAPQPRLARAQAWVLSQILEKLPTEDAAHGFVPGRSTVSHAAPHVGRDIVVTLDLKAFFPTITFPRVRGFFKGLGYSPAVATLLALLCTACPRRLVRLGEQTWWVAVGDRALPQGACTSPALSNAIARNLDRRLTGLARSWGWVYTRYADDLTFSAPAGHQAQVGRLMSTVAFIVREEGFALNPDKGRVMRRSGRQTVTGVVVNQKTGLPRSEVRRLRALLHNAAKTGLAAQNRGGHPNFEAWIAGKLGYLAMVDPVRAAPLLQALAALRR